MFPSPPRGSYISIAALNKKVSDLERFRPLLGVPISQFIGGFALALGALLFPSPPRGSYISIKNLLLSKKK